MFREQRFLVGFTLVELLVVIAIIGLLSSLAVVVAREARDRGRDTKIQTSLSQVRFEATLIYNRDDSYADLCCSVAPCDPDTLNDANDNLRILEDEVRKNSGSDPICYVNVEGDAYCVQSSLVSGGSYCLDSTGYAGTSLTTCDQATADCATD